LGDAESARLHRRVARQMNRRRTPLTVSHSAPTPRAASR
jgi:hypothetical protein